MSRLMVLLIGTLVLNAPNALGAEPDSATQSCNSSGKLKSAFLCIRVGCVFYIIILGGKNHGLESFW